MCSLHCDISSVDYIVRTMISSFVVAMKELCVLERLPRVFPVKVVETRWLSSASIVLADRTSRQCDPWDGKVTRRVLH